jgi:hypothetical protein
MTTIGLLNYKFGKKNIWRRWAWNKIKDYSELNGKKTKDLIGLYLIGSDDCDFKVAKEKGFNGLNLIGIDLEKEYVKNHRNNYNGIGICCSLQKLLFCWPKDFRLDFVNADFPCGITGDVKEFLSSLCFSSAIYKNTVIVMNFKRGREKGLNLSGKFPKEIRKLLEDNMASSSIGDVSCHRGFFALNGMIIPMLNKYGYDVEIFRYSKPKLNVYQSNNSVMDSIAFIWPVDNHLHENSKLLYEFNRDNETVRKIAAARAIRTTRLNQRLKT